MPLRIRPTGTVRAATGHRLEHADLKTLAEAISGMAIARASFGGVSWSQPPPRRGRQREVSLRVTLSMRMPVWTKRRNRPKAERDEWDRFYKALRFHEDGHIALYRREFAAAFERIKAVAPDQIQDTLDAEIERIRRLNDQYDTDTDHGRTQETPHGTTVINVP